MLLVNPTTIRNIPAIPAKAVLPHTDDVVILLCVGRDVSDELPGMLAVILIVGVIVLGFIIRNAFLELSLINSEF